MKDFDAFSRVHELRTHPDGQEAPASCNSTQTGPEGIRQGQHQVRQASQDFRTIQQAEQAVGWISAGQIREEPSSMAWLQKMDEKPSWGKDAWASEWKPFRNRDSSGSLDWWIQ